MKRDWIRSFSVPIYDFKVKLVVTRDIIKWADKNPQDHGTSPSDSCRAIFNCRDQDQMITIVIEPTSSLSDIAHEIGHAARHIMNYIGFRITAENDEPLAFLEDFMHRKVNEIIKKAPRRKTKSK